MVSRRQFLERAAELGIGATVISGCVARLRTAGSELSLANDSIAGQWSVADGVLRTLPISDHRRQLDTGDAVFSLTFADGSTLPATGFRVARGPVLDRVNGRRVTVHLEDPAGRLRATWRGILRDDARYLRQEVTLEALGRPQPVREISLIDVRAPGAAVSGTVKGSPIVAGDWFLGFEHPLSTSTVDAGRGRAVLTRELPLRPGVPLTVSSVIGVVRPGQLRRDFLAYVERERAHPYRPFLHYNSWYDIGYFSKYNEPEALAVIEAFGSELVRRRGVRLSSFLFDDGWDDPKTLWGFHSGFPNGFTPLRQAAERYGAAPGVWLSPWGGYGKPKEERITNGQAQGFETNRGGFALSGPKYYQRFRETCLTMIRRYGVNQFKIDGTGNAANAIPGSAFDSDFDAAITLIGELRKEKPDLYVNLTTGTYPSPFWLRHADSIWRGGEDHSFAGVGTSRQQWITYRDGDTFRGVVSRGPLFPLNALMLHGLIYARKANRLDTDPADDFTDEIRSYFGTGTQLQEMYVTPALLTPENWDRLAEAANWARRNADVLVDTHWVGGDPRQLEVYGHAAWSPRGGVLSLRNPSNKPQSIAIDVARAFELPANARGTYRVRDAWTRAEKGTLVAGREHVFSLAPFEVVTLEAEPV